MKSQNIFNQSFSFEIMVDMVNNSMLLQDVVQRDPCTLHLVPPRVTSCKMSAHLQTDVDAVKIQSIPPTWRIPFIFLRSTPTALLFPSPNPWRLLICSLCLCLAFWECYINGTTRYGTIWNWLFSLNMASLRFIQAVVLVVHSFCWLSGAPRYRNICCCFQFGVITNRALRNICI